MPRYIDVDDAIKVADYVCGEFRGLFGRMKERLEALQTVDVVKRKRGNWETEIRTIHSHKIPFLACSICGIYAADEYTYCPHCGAEMETESTGSAGENKEKEIRT